MAYPKEQMSLVVMDTFKGKENDDLRERCAKNNCEIVVIPHNLTNKFQPLDLSVKKAAKASVSSEMYGIWIANEISKHLKKDIAPLDVKVSSVIKPLYAK